ncbi:DNA mismatch repair endonuclease MutL [Clostridium thermarum]|uniref:DNA mismatch repair endonuclease MutL n=1 Tax=Clostridium thermarum TaxID=1716543 RepID=UPI0013D09CA7|nr:DNA mismatch repair endonuclease MutL [Clostridium thermarum]
MKRISVLSEDTSNKIAAGEVVERPFSVVKELVENSIDAGAKNISIEIEEGGQKRISIMDDGQGIHPEDITKAFLPHATSKINKIEDIYRINTFGFRGEALASIASVSKVKLKSRTEEFDIGREIEIKGGYVESIKDTGSNIGTFIEVRDLFYNVPARLKFLKSTSKETSSISDIISRIALCNNNIAFKLINNGKKVFQTYGNGNLKDVIRIIYGKNTVENLIYFEGHTDTASVFGYVGNQELSRGSRNNQSIFVNRRYIKNKLITAAVENAMKSFLTINKFPFFILFLDIYPELIDVNVHPTKAEIKFNDDRSIFKLVFDSVHKCMGEALKDTFMSDIEEEKEYIPKGNIVKEKSEPLYFHNVIYSNEKNNPEDSISSLPIDLSGESNSRIEHYQEKDSISTDIRVNLTEESSGARNINPQPEVFAKLPTLKYIGTFYNTYIICELGDELYLIDQHAAHERILFERYRSDIKKGTVVSQISLTPLVLELSLEDYVLFNEYKEIFISAGFHIEDFGDNTITIRETPYILGKLDSKSFLLQMLDSIRNFGTANTIDVKYDNIARMACKAAVKAHDKLSQAEIEKLLEDLKYCENPYNCPHGRPTIIKMSLYEIEKRFKRIQ